jgi:molybdopterin-guanine dinucleotide biosynthesis protein A
VSAELPSRGNRGGSRPRFGAAILAGGRASRFGGALKGLERVGGVRIVDRVREALVAHTDSLLLVANHPEAQSWLPGVPTIADLRPGLGALGGIHAALAHSPMPTFVVAWDMPFVGGGLLGELARLGAAGASAVIPESAPGRLEPLCAWYAPTLLPAIEARLDVGLRRAAGLVEVEGARRLPVDEVRRFGDPTRLFLSVNTVEDLARAEAIAAEA